MSNISHYKPLMLNAIQQSNLPLIRDAIKAGISVDMVDVHDMTLLHHAVNEGRLDVALLLLELGANPNAQKPDMGFTPLHYGTYRLNATMVKTLLNANASPHIVARGQGTPLHMAAACGDARSIELLADAGGDVFQKYGEFLPIDILRIRNDDRFNFNRHRYPAAEEMLLKKMAEREQFLAARQEVVRATHCLKKRQSGKFQL